ncbi:serine/threonine protein kinase [bacterium CPR1]|nr:serine/threonine protein kinase [bacterium CPR1]
MLADDSPPDATLVQAPDQLARARLDSSDSTPAAPPGYSLKCRLGVGSFGEVWAAVQLRTDQHVAIKFFRRAGLDIDYLKLEVARLRQVASHRFVVSLLDADLEHDPPFYVMPLLDRSLEDELRPSLKTAVGWIQQLALALRHLHDKGVLHCDLKPSNVLLDEEKAVRLSDFGQSRSRNEKSAAFGTLGFMPPEQVRDEAEPGVSWDVYSFGATCYAVLTERYPRLSQEDQTSLRSSNSTLEQLDLYKNLLDSRPLTPVRELRSEVDPELACILECCLRLDPLSRTPSMHEVVEDLQRWQAREPLLCRRPWTRSYRLERFLARPLVALSLLLLAFFPLFVNTYLTLKTRTLLVAEVKQRVQQVCQMARSELHRELSPRREALSRLAQSQAPLEAIEGFENLLLLDGSGKVLKSLAPWSAPLGTPGKVMMPPGDDLLLVAASPDPNLFLAGVLPRSSLEDRLAEGFRLALPGREELPAVSRYVNQAGQDVVGANLPLDGFVLVYELPADTALAAADEILVKNRWLNLLVICVLLLFVLVASGRQAGGAGI